MIKIRVPATSANLGVGFDCMGLAVSLYSTISFEKSDQKLEITGCPKEFQNENNLVYQAFVKGCQYLEKPVPQVKITIANNVPLARGLGSSAVCIVAGLEAARVWFDIKVSKTELLDLATQMEGHPDNVAPAIYGKLGVSFKDENQDVQTVNFEVDPKLQFVALIPDYQVSTEAARKALPTTMSYQTAVYQIGHAVALSKALELGNLQLIKKAIVDKMHEPFRSKLIPNYEQVKNLCQQNGGLMYISGSGSTMMAIVDNKESAEKIISDSKKIFPSWQIEPVKVDLDGVVSSKD